MSCTLVDAQPFYNVGLWLGLRSPIAVWQHCALGLRNASFRLYRILFAGVSIPCGADYLLFQPQV